MRTNVNVLKNQTKVFLKLYNRQLSCISDYCQRTKPKNDSQLITPKIKYKAK